MSVALAPGLYTRPADETLLAPRHGAARRELARARLLWQALRSFDVIHFNYGSSITPRSYPASVTGERGTAKRLFDAYARVIELLDLPLLKGAGKALFVTYLGDDARQADLARKRSAITQFHESNLPHDDPELDARKRDWIATFARYVDGIYAVNPDLLHVLPPWARFVPYASVDVPAHEPVPSSPDAGPPVVAHAPTNRSTKGTRFVLDAVDRLRQDGVDFEFVLLEGISHAEAQQAYRRVDLFVDQLLAGWYGTVAVELMALAKPVVAYLRDEDLGFIPPAMREQLPIVRATPNSVYEVVREWLTIRRAELADRGRASRAYAERWHDPMRIAAELKADYERALGR